METGGPTAAWSLATGLPTAAWSFIMRFVMLDFKYPPFSEFFLLGDSVASAFYVHVPEPSVPSSWLV
jgi:hypothetical protein